MVDVHGKEVINFQISFTIWFMVSAILIFVVIGIFLLVALALLQLVFVIIGALKADRGELFRYPMTIQFIK